MFSKEGELKKLDSAYSRITISIGGYENPELTRRIENEKPMRIGKCISDFIKSYQENSLYLKYESLLKYCSEERIMYILLSNMEDSNENLCLYLFVNSDEELNRAIKTLNKIYSYKKEWTQKFWHQWDDDGYVIMLEDNRFFAKFNHLKIYPDGRAFIITDYDYKIEETQFILPDELISELKTEIKRRVEKTLCEKRCLLIDDREFLKAFVITYGFNWLGYRHSLDYDYKDYFLEKPSKIINKLMKLPVVKEKFVNARFPDSAIERITADI